MPSSLLQSAAPTPQISIEITGGGAVVTGCPLTILNTLAERRMFFGLNHGGQILQRAARIPLHGQDSMGRTCLSANLIPRLVGRLRDHGIQYSLVDRRTWGEEYAIDPEVTGHDIYSEGMLNAVTQHPSGQLVLAAAKDAISWIAVICQRFRYANILVMVGTEKRAWQIWNGLVEHLADDVALYTHSNYDRASCVVSTYRSLELRLGDIIILPEPVEAIGKRASDIISLLQKRQRRTYALVQPNVRLSPREQILLEQLTGPVIYDPCPQKVAVYVSMMDVHSTPVVDETDGLTWKRTAYWLNDRRNVAIAAIAQGAAGGDMAAFWDAGILLDEKEDYLQNIVPSDVTVLLESTEHGRELHRLLPDWHLRHLRPGESITAAPAAGIQGPAGEIATVAYAAQHGVQAGILIRTDGGDSPIAIKGFPATEGRTPFDAALVIDVDDRFCKRAKRESQRRRRHYRREGWHVDGDGDVPAGDNAGHG